MRNILVLTNLYPLPWEKNRATFNRQQFDRLGKVYRVFILVPIAWPEWLKRGAAQKQICNAIDAGSIRYTWYLYIPKLGRALYGGMMFVSLLLNSFFWVRKKNVDLIIGSWAYPDGIAAYLLARLLGKKFILKVHGSDINVAAESKLRAWQIGFIASRSDGVLAVSNALKDRLLELGVAEEKVSVLYNGVDQQLFNVESCPANNAGSQVLYVGNLKKEKGVLELVAAFEQLLERHSQAKLVYAGAGECFDEIEALLKQKNLDQSVDLLGSVNHCDLPQLMGRATMIVLPSYNEGVPNVLLEAMASGKPVVATRVGGIPEIVEEGVTGILCAPKNISGLVEAMDQCLSKRWDTALIASHAKKFNWSDNTAGLEKLIEASIAS